MRISDAIQLFLTSREATCAPTTLRSYQVMLRQVKDYFGGREVEDIQLEDLEIYIAQLRKRSDPRSGRSLSNIYVNGHRRVIKTLFRFLVKRRVLVISPAAELAGPRVVPNRKPLTEDQVENVIALLQMLTHATHLNIARDRALIYFMLDTASRANEVIQLEIADTNMAGAVALLHGKGGKDRRVGFSADTRAALQTYLGDRTEGRLFLTDEGKPLVYSSLRQIIRRISKKVGFHIYLHQLRITFATLYILEGGQMSFLQATLGHASEAMTKHYARTAIEIRAVEEQQRFGFVSRLMPVIKETALLLEGNPDGQDGPLSDCIETRSGKE